MSRRIAPVLVYRSRMGQRGLAGRDIVLAVDDSIALSYGPDRNHKRPYLSITLASGSPKTPTRRRWFYGIEIDARNVNEIIRFVTKCRKKKGL